MLEYVIIKDHSNDIIGMRMFVHESRFQWVGYCSDRNRTTNTGYLCLLFQQMCYVSIIFSVYWNLPDNWTFLLQVIDDPSGNSFIENLYPFSGIKTLLNQ